MKKSARTRKLILRRFLLVLLYIAVVAVQVVLFLLLQSLEMPPMFDKVALGIVVAMVLALIVFAVVNKVRFRKLVKKYNDKDNVVATYNEMQSYYEKAQSDYINAEKYVVAKKNKIILYKVLLSLFVALIAVVCAFGAKKDTSLISLTEFFVVVGVSSMFVAPLLWIDLLTLFQDASEYHMQELSEKEYPEFYAVVKDAEKTLGCNTPFKIYPVYGSSIAVSSSSNCIHICFDCEETMLLTRDELYQILLHEIAHVVNSDTKRSRSLAHFSYAMEHFGASSTNTFFSAEYVDFTVKNTGYYLACTRFYEQAADEAVRKHGNGQVYINGTAKGMFLELFRSCYKPKVDFDVYSNEHLPSDFYVTHLQFYKEYLAANFDKWDFLLRNRIQSRQDTHPTFAMRMKFMGVDSYDCSAVETHVQFVAEQHKLLKLGCLRLAEETKGEYKNAREQYYLPTKAKIDEYHSLQERGESLSIQQKTDFIGYLFDAEREECLKLCNEVLQDSPNNAYANFYKGMILSDLLDKNCVACLYAAAAENVNFAEIAINTVGEFACNVGDTELLQEYRSRATEDIADMMSRQESSVLHDTDQVTANLLAEKDYSDILNFILKMGGDMVQNVYSVSRGDGKEMLTTYLVEINSKTKMKDVEKFYNEVFGYLDRYDGDFHFEFRLGYPSDRKKISRKIKATEGALLYSQSVGKVSRRVK